MKEALKYFASVYVLWVLFFLAFRVVFLVYHLPRVEEFPVLETLTSIRKGLLMDFSTAGYFSIIPFMLWMLRAWMPFSSFRFLVSAYMVIFLGIAGLGFCIDLEIFANWGHRLDSAIIPYLLYPKEAFASAFSSPLVRLITLWAGFTLVFSWLWWKNSGIPVSKSPQPVFAVLSSVIFAGILIIPIRGGFQLAPINQSSVYYSSHRVLNQAAENALWVFFQSILEGGDEAMDALYAPFHEKEVSVFMDKIYYRPGRPDTVLTQVRPNIILVVWESLTTKVSGAYGGKYPSTPNLDSLIGKGIQFENMYASGDRSDKGLAAILASVPALGKMSIMAQPNQTARLHFINQDLKNAGYSTRFMYGGELEFANMKSFLLHAGFDQLIGKDDFPSSTYNSKWGAHDEVLFDRQLEEADKEKGPFFHTLFTLSSHEPFEIPGVSPPVDLPVDSLFCRAHRYTDRCLGNWLRKASEKPWWKNTLVIVIADHGHALPGHSPESDPEKYRIPMVWAGPVILEPGSKVMFNCSQTDLYRTLLTQLRLPSPPLAFSRSLIGRTPESYAFYSFRNGSVFIQNDTMGIAYDKVNKRTGAGYYRQSVYTQLYKNRKRLN